MAFDFKSNSAYNDILRTVNTSAYNSFGQGLGQQNIDDYTSQVNSLGDKFSNMFQTYVGRAPTAAEQDQFVQQYIKPNATKLADGGSNINQDPNTYLNQFISNTFQPAAKDYATQQLTDQKGQANDLANLFRTQGNDAINSTEQSLLDYQSKLFEKLRPQLITSLNAQGLLDTGAVNSAQSGAEADLANSVQPFLANARLNNEQQANAISFAGASAPLQYQQGNILNSVPYLQGQGQTAANQGYNTFLTGLNYQDQLSLLNRQNEIQQGNQPSFMRTFSQNFGAGLGQNLSSWASPQAYQAQGNGGTSGAAGAKMLFS